MSTGNWDVYSTDNKITFNENGELIDGQHRLKAIIKSGKTIYMRVFRGVSSNAHIFDKCAVRDTATAARMVGIQLTKNDASVIRTVFSEYHIQPVTDTMIGDYARVHGSEIYNARMICSKGSGGKIGRYSICGAAAYFASRCGVSDETLARFFRVVNTGESLSELDFTAIAVRNLFLETNLNIKTQLGRKALFNGVTDGISAFEQGFVKKRLTLNRTHQYVFDAFDADEELIKEYVSLGYGGNLNNIKSRSFVNYNLD